MTLTPDEINLMAIIATIALVVCVNELMSEGD